MNLSESGSPGASAKYECPRPLVKTDRWNALVGSSNDDLRLRLYHHPSSILHHLFQFCDPTVTSSTLPSSPCTLSVREDIALAMLRRFIRFFICAVMLAGLLPTSSSRASQFLNLSTRGFVAPNDHALIGGFILNGSYSKRILLRGIGPSLSAAGLSGVLNDPTLEIRDQDGNVYFSNDNWQDSQKSEIEGTNLAPHNDREAAIVLRTFPAGNYTVLLRDAAGGSGI